MHRLLILASLVLMGTVAPAQPTSLSEAEQAQLQQNLDRGLKLYQYDQAAWHVTDAAMTALSDSTKSVLRGYVTTPVPNGLKTTFFGEIEGRTYAFYSAIWTGSAIEAKTIYGPDQRVPLSDEERRLIEARRVAIEGAESLSTCSSAPANAIVVPGASADEPVSVYILTPQTKNGSYPLGGHHRIDVKDGRVIAKRTFTKTCIEFDTGSQPDKGAPEAAVITHLLDPIPTELHVFSVLAMRLPLYVSVRDRRVYVVEVSGGQPRARLVPQ